MDKKVIGFTKEHAVKRAVHLLETFHLDNGYYPEFKAEAELDAAMMTELTGKQWVVEEQTHNTDAGWRLLLCVVPLVDKPKKVFSGGK